MKPQIIDTKKGKALWTQPVGRRISGEIVAVGMEAIKEFVDDVTALLIEEETGQPTHKRCKSCRLMCHVDDFVKITHCVTCKRCRKGKGKS